MGVDFSALCNPSGDDNEGLEESEAGDMTAEEVASIFPGSLSADDMAGVRITDGGL